MASQSQESNSILKLWLGGVVAFVFSTIIASFSTYIALEKGMITQAVTQQALEEKVARQEKDIDLLRSKVENLELKSQSSEDSIHFIKEVIKENQATLKQALSDIGDVKTSLKIIEATIADQNKKK